MCLETLTPTPSDLLCKPSTRSEFTACSSRTSKRILGFTHRKWTHRCQRRHFCESLTWLWSGLSCHRLLLTTSGSSGPPQAMFLCRKQLLQAGLQECCKRFCRGTGALPSLYTPQWSLFLHVSATFLLPFFRVGILRQLLRTFSDAGEVGILHQSSGFGFRFRGCSQ